MVMPLTDTSQVGTAEPSLTDHPFIKPFSDLTNYLGEQVAPYVPESWNKPLFSQSSPLPTLQSPEAVMQSKAMPSKKAQQTRQSIFQAEQGHTAQMKLMKRDGGQWGEIYLVSPSKKLSDQQYQDIALEYQQKHRESIKRGQVPTDTIQGVRVAPTSNLLASAETKYQQYGRPALREAYETILPNYGLIQQQNPPLQQGIAEFATPQDLPQLGGMAAGLATGGALGTASALPSSVGRMAQRGAAAVLPGLTHGATSAGETGQFPLATTGAETGINILSQIIGSKIGLKLDTRVQQKMMKEINTVLNNIERIDPVTGQMVKTFKTLTPKDAVGKLVNSGYNALNDTLQESTDQLVNLLHTKQGVSALTTQQTDDIRQGLKTSIDVMRQYLRTGQDLSTMQKTVGKNINTIVSTTRDAFLKVDNLARRAGLIENLLDSTDPSVKKRVMRYLSSTNPLEEKVVQMYLTNQQALNPHQILQRSGVSRQQFESTADKVWERFATAFSDDFMKQYQGIFVRDLEGIVLLDALKQAGLSGRFDMKALQTYMMDHSERLLSDLRVIGQVTGSAFGSSAPRGVKGISTAAFRGGMPGEDVSKTKQFPLPSLNLGRFKLPLGVETGPYTDYVGSLGTPFLAPGASQFPQIVNPLAIKTLTQERSRR